MRVEWPSPAGVQPGEREGAVAIADFEREQRLRDINRRLREITARRAAIEEQYSSPPLDISAELAALREETTLLRAERMELQEPEFNPDLLRQYISRMWDQVIDLQKFNRRWVRPVLVILVFWAIGMTALQIWIGSSLWQLTSLWR